MIRVRRALAKVARHTPIGKFTRVFGGFTLTGQVSATTAEDLAFKTFVQANFDGEGYLLDNPDVPAAGVDPLEHWLEWELSEGRPFVGSAVIRNDVVAGQSRSRQWQHFTWRGVPVAAKAALPNAKAALPKSITRQILRQARHDPGVLAPGALALPGSCDNAVPIDVYERGGIDATGLLTALPMRPKTVLVLSRLVAGEAEKYPTEPFWMRCSPRATVRCWWC